MKQKDVIKKIGGIIQELSDQYEYLQTVPGDLNDLELELFVSNAHFLTDHIEILCKLNIQNSIARRPTTKFETTYEQKYFEPMVQQMKQAAGLPTAKVKATAISLKPADTGKAVQKTGEEKPSVEINKTVDSPEEEMPVPTVEQSAIIFEDDKPLAHDEAPVKDFGAEELVAEEEQGMDDIDGQQPVPHIDISSETPDDSYAATRQEPETIRHEFILDEAENSDEEESILSLNGTLNVAEKRKEEIPATLFDEALKEDGGLNENTFEPVTAVSQPEEDEVLTINQKISAQLADRAMLKTELPAIKPISDIKLAITLNDKLLYVKDLFNGYNLAYAEAIEILNRFNTFEEASRFLKTNYVTKNNWDNKPATTEKFYALLKRRYA